MAQNTGKGPGRLIRSLASLRLAVAVLGLLAVVLAAATIYESRNGATAAQRDIYQARWFQALLVLLGVNVAAAAIVRWPWRLRQAGFLITHLAILVILAGSLVTHGLGSTGRLVLTEGQQDNKILQDGWAVQAAAHGTGAGGDAIRIDIGELPKAGREVHFQVGSEDCTMKILRYLPHATARWQLAEGTDTDPPAVLVELGQPDANQPDHHPQQWLLVDDKGQWAIHAPGFSLAAASEYVAPAKTASDAAAKGTLVATIDGKEYEADVEQALAGPVALAEGKVGVRVTGYYEHATVGTGGRLTEDPQRPVNPAVVVDLTVGDTTQKRIIFARFGDISAMHGDQQEQTVRLSLRHAGATDTGMKVVLVRRQDKWVLHEDNGSRVLQEIDLETGVPATLQGMPVSLTVKKMLAHARPQRVVTAAPLPAGADPQPALHVELRGPAGLHRDWLTESQPAMFALGPQTVQLTLAPRQEPLPFTIRLDKFELERYAGSTMPAMYRSKVTVLDSEHERQLSQRIEMNRPLEYRGWLFFQSGYSMNGQQSVSILAASKDPGQPIVYVGAVLLIAGTAMLAVQRLKPPAARAAAKTGKDELSVSPAPPPAMARM